ncbi:hypothetical protein [Roseateles paludis]|uniref:Glycosyl transferase n=1 Tax=Roseateles paludis TaxID=3145238 RepID=A0ABV0G003_9BURK
MRLPITLAQLPTLAKQMAQREYRLAFGKDSKPVFRLCYFSCQSYFPYLYCALHSLVQTVRSSHLEVFVFSDTDMPLSAAQTEALMALPLQVKVIPWPKSVGWGAEQIGWIWRAYALACEGLSDDDFIARIDSDVFFFNDRIFRAMARSRADFIGDGHYVDFEYCQGGAYFLRVSAARAVLKYLESNDLTQVLAQAQIGVEDRAVMHFAALVKLKTWMTCFMMFPDELRNAGGLTALARFKFSCLHFTSKNKAGMIDAYVAGVLPHAEQAAFKAVLSTP